VPYTTQASLIFNQSINQSINHIHKLSIKSRLQLFVDFGFDASVDGPVAIALIPTASSRWRRTCDQHNKRDDADRPTRCCGYTSPL